MSITPTHVVISEPNGIRTWEAKTIEPPKTGDRTPTRGKTAKKDKEKELYVKVDANLSGNK